MAPMVKKAKKEQPDVDAVVLEPDAALLEPDEEEIDLEDDVVLGADDDVLLEVEDDDALDLEEEHHPDDVEEGLDIVLRERTASFQVDADEAEIDDEEEDEEERGETDGRIRPKRPGEFVCRSCFLVKHPSQLADKKQSLCRDCV